MKSEDLEQTEISVNAGGKKNFVLAEPCVVMKTERAARKAHQKRIFWAACGPSSSE
jgi:hypothetical protein